MFHAFKRLTAHSDAVQTTGMFNYMLDSEDNWHSFTRAASAAHIDGIKIQTSANKDYYLSYQTQHENRDYFFPAVTSLENDYAGYPGLPIQKLCIRVYDKEGNSLSSGVVVMYRVKANGRWQAWVSNAGADWMQAMYSKHGLSGELDTVDDYAGADGYNITGVEICIFEDDAEVPGHGDFEGDSVPAAMQYMTGSGTQLVNFQNKILASPITGIKLQTPANAQYYLTYQTLHENRDYYFPAVDSNEDDYAGYPDMPIQKLSISVKDLSGNSLSSGIIVMYRVYTNGAWLPWVSNAAPNLMQNIQTQYQLGGSLDTSAYEAGISGSNIGGVEIRIFEGDSYSSSLGGMEGEDAQLSYIDQNGNEHVFNNQVISADIDGIKIQTDPAKPYYIYYRTWNEGKTGYYPSVSSTEDDYAGYPGKGVQLLNIQAFRNSDDASIVAGIVIMYRAYVNGSWLPWVSNAEPEWMESVWRKYDLGGSIDPDGYYSGVPGVNISGVEIRVFEEDSLFNGVTNPVGNHKMIQAPFISHMGPPKSR